MTGSWKERQPGVRAVGGKLPGDVVLVIQAPRPSHVTPSVAVVGIQTRQSVSRDGSKILPPVLD